ITREAAGEAIRASDAKISRIELGRVGFKARDVADLLTLYDVADQNERETFFALVRRANEPGWWRQYGDVLSNWFETYLGLEQASSVIRTYEVQFVPGLLQTEDCARAVMQLCQLHSSAEEVDRRVALRMARQDFLTQPGAPDYWAVVDEAVLRRPLGSQQTLRAQVRHLIEMAELPNITLQVVPFRTGGHVAAGGPFTILRFAEPDLPDIVYLEQLTSAVYLDKKHETDNYLLVMDRLCVKAESPTDTTSFLKEIIKEI
ncbi:MAG: helix-turn-helix domain-containing protein, partial [Actinomycetes bacterium]